jgi:hypothetical protein
MNRRDINMWLIMVDVYTGFVLTRGVGDGANEENNGGKAIKSLRW